MLWTEVRKWAKEQGYAAIKSKGDESNGEKFIYSWSRIDNPEESGVAKSVSKLAKAIYNHITDNKWLDHQTEYNNNKEAKRITLTDYGT